MKRIAKLLVRIYPSTWRERYGEEFEALIEDGSLGAAVIIDVLWGALKMRVASRSFVRVVLPCMLAGTLGAVAISLVVPMEYSSQAIVTAAPQRGPATIPDDLARNNFRDAFSRDFLASVIQERNLYPDKRAHMSLDGVIGEMSRSIRVSPGLFTHSSPVRSFSAQIFAVQFEYSDPHIAQQVNTDLVARFLNTALKVKVAPDSSGSSSATLPSGEHFALSVLNAPSLPTRPIGSDRIQKSLVGLCVGLGIGLASTAVFNWRRRRVLADS